MLNFYQIVKENLNFNRFQYKDTVCLEYTCPIEAEDVGIYSKCDYIVHVLSGRKTYKTIDGEWTLEPGQTLYLKKGAELIHQYFDDEYCMLAFFISDDLIRETFNELKGESLPEQKKVGADATGMAIDSSQFLDGYFHSMLNYFRGINRPADSILVLKLKELLISLMNDSPTLTHYFQQLSESSGPSIKEVMEQNYCYKLKLEDYAELTNKSLSAFKRAFKEAYNESPGKWITKRRIDHALNVMRNTSLNVTQVAFESGFEDLSHFSRVFKSIVGVSPGHFRSNLVE
ncbi:MAG: helix-turn-helix transcriptional regulator [Cyclobacteriaceae bacterium]